VAVTVEEYFEEGGVFHDEFLREDVLKAFRPALERHCVEKKTN
jgi:hypothetical protein